MRLGGTIQVVSDTFAESVSSAENNLSKLPVRIYTGARLVAGQILLMAIPVAVVNLSALIPVVLALLISSLSLAGLWDRIPGNGWFKGVIVGAIYAGIVALLVVLQVFSFHVLFSLGILIVNIWMGGLFMGGRSSG